MAYLQTKDFNKGASAGAYAGKDRHEIVLLKIKRTARDKVRKETSPETKLQLVSQ